ncbi:hypothetical protein AWW66_03505 [Micromonospora rosaria]|uniref:Uncharacterized protein n=1 Tax=Micromonospora rosaria TaxID=47874 RepID=A0A136PYF1_9ACTN|nr:hypothetical protein AWW66_03505 [Micromonospora rosaria]
MTVVLAVATVPWWAPLSAALLISGAIVAHAVIVAPTEPAGCPLAPLDDPAQRAVATAILQPDRPLLAPDQETALLGADGVGDEAEQYLRKRSEES